MSLPRILIDSTPFRATKALDGIGRYVHDLLHGLAQTRSEWEHEVEIEALVDVPWVGRATTSTDLSAAAEAGRNGPREREGLLAARRWTTLGRTVHERRADVVHLPHARGVPIWLPASVIVTCHNLIPLRYPGEYIGPPLRRTSRWARDFHRFRLSDRVVAVSDKTRSELAMLRVPASRIDVIPSGLDLDRWSPQPLADDSARLERLRVGTKPYLLNVGFCDFRKNVRAMFDTLTVVRRDVDAELVWVGDLAEKRLESMHKLARECGVDSAVRFLGFVGDEDLAALYRRARALLYLSRLEGAALPVIEAMASGCPTIVARSSGSDDIAAEAALAVESDDVLAAADAALSVSRDEAIREACVRVGLERAQRLDRRVMARSHVETYLRAARGQ